MNPLLTFQLRRIGRNKQYLLFTVLLPALFTVFFTKVFGAQAGSGAQYQAYATTVDVLFGMLLTLPSLLVVGLVGRVVNGVQLGLGTWAGLVAVLWLGSTAFVALGLLIGLALDEKAAGGAMGLVGVVLATLGGLWVPVQFFPDALQTVARALPSYWYAELGRDVVAGSAPALTGVLALSGFAAAFAVLATLVAARRPLHAVSG